MYIVPLLIGVIAPSFSLLLYVYLRDRYEREPIQLVVKMFLYGVSIVGPILLVQQLLVKSWGESNVLFSFFLSGGIEETCKWLLLYVMIFRHREFDEPYDGIVYAVAVSLGFATLENLIYVILNDSEMSTLLLRALLPVSGHALFGVIMGYYIGKAKYDSKKALRFLSFSLLIPIFWHGFYDWLILTTKSYYLWVIIPLMTLLWLRALQTIKHAQDRSFFKIGKPADDESTKQNK